MNGQTEREALPANWDPLQDAGAVAQWLFRPVPLAKRTYWTYVKHTVFSPLNLVSTTTLILACLMTQSLFITATVGVGWATLLFVLPRIGAVQSLIDRKLERIDRLLDEQLRAALRAEIDSDHRRTLERLERLIAEVGSPRTSRARAVQDVLRETVDLDDLPSSYLRLAVAHRRNRDLLAMTNRDEIDREIEDLESTREQDSGKMRSLSERRLGLLEARARQWDERLSELNAIELQLETIEDLVYLLHDLASTVAASHEFRDVDELLDNMEDVRSTVRQLARIGDDAESIQPLPRHTPRSHTRDLATFDPALSPRGLW